MRRATGIKARQRQKGIVATDDTATSEEITTNEENTDKTVVPKKGGRIGKVITNTKPKETDSENEDSETQPKKAGSEGSEAEDVEEQYEVDKVVDMKVVRGTKKYRIRWKGYNSDSDTWETEENLNCPAAINEYLEQLSSQNEKSSDVTAGKKRSSKVATTRNDTQVNVDENSSADNETEMPPAKKKKAAKKTKSAKKDSESADDELEKVEDEEEKNVKQTSEAEDKVKSPKMRSKGKKAVATSDTETENGMKSEEPSYEVDKIMEVHHKRNGKKEYLIHWRGYPHAQDTWEPEEHLDCEELIKNFEAKVEKVKNLNIRELRTERSHTTRYTEEVGGKRHSKRGNQKLRTTYFDNE